jgi:glycogen phosphorylase
MSQPSPSNDRHAVADAVQTRDTSHVLTLEEISALAAEGGKPAETLMNVVALIARRFETDVCSVYLVEPDRANLVLAATVGLRPDCIGVLRMSIQEGLAGLVAEQVRPVAVEQARNHPRFKYFREAGAYSRSLYRTRAGEALVPRPQSLVELGSRLHKPVPRP